MTAEPTYEYRVACPDGDDGDVRYVTLAEARSERDGLDEECTSDCHDGARVHRIQRRLITPWEDCDE